MFYILKNCLRDEFLGYPLAISSGVKYLLLKKLGVWKAPK